MTTHVTTDHPARTDLATTVAGSATPTSTPTSTVGTSRVTSTRWALAGVVAGIAGIGTVISTSMVNAVYDKSIALDEDAIVAKLADQTTPMLVFHVVSAIGALALVVFAAGLHRRLRQRLDDSIAPGVAFAGLAGTAVVSVLGGGLDTEFVSGVDHALPANAAMYNHWIGTVPWCWLLVGLSALAVFSAWRQGAVPRWMGVLSLILGGLTVLVGVLPIQYLAIVPGALWVLAVSVGFLAGDRARGSA